MTGARRLVGGLRLIVVNTHTERFASRTTPRRNQTMVRLNPPLTEGGNPS